LEALLEHWYKENSFDGFYNENEQCGCQIGDITPCGFPEIAANEDQCDYLS
jgi:hypothetical protein